MRGSAHTGLSCVLTGLWARPGSFPSLPHSLVLLPVRVNLRLGADILVVEWGRLVGPKGYQGHGMASDGRAVLPVSISGAPANVIGGLGAVLPLFLMLLFLDVMASPLVFWKCQTGDLQARWFCCSFPG